MLKEIKGTEKLYRITRVIGSQYFYAAEQWDDEMTV